MSFAQDKASLSGAFSLPVSSSPPISSARKLGSGSGSGSHSSGIKDPLPHCPVLRWHQMTQPVLCLPLLMPSGKSTPEALGQ